MRFNRTLRELCLADNKVGVEVMTQLAGRLRGSTRETARSARALELSIPAIHQVRKVYKSKKQRQKEAQAEKDRLEEEEEEEVEKGQQVSPRQQHELEHNNEVSSRVPHLQLQQEQHEDFELAQEGQHDGRGQYSSYEPECPEDEEDPPCY